MANLWVIVLVLMLAVTTAKARPVLPESFLESGSNSIADNTPSVFEKGDLETTMIRLEESDSSAPPQPLLIVTPRKPGTYPVLYFIHGLMVPNDFYSEIFERTASHGFVIVAPQLYSIPTPPQTEEIERAVSVANWLGPNLDSVLPEGVKGDLSRLAISGHSRGGKTAFAVALGKHETPLKVKISALIGVDAVEGPSKALRTEPFILTYVPNSFNLSIPVTIMGTGLGNQSVIPLGPSCAPDEVSHKELFNECKEDCTLFVLTDYGHTDMLDADVGSRLPIGPIVRSICVNGKADGGPARKTVAGIMVAFLDAYFLDEAATFSTILADPSVAPAKLFPVKAKQAQRYAQV